MSFDLSDFPSPIQFIFKSTAPSLWPTVTLCAIACGVKDPNVLADLAFHLHHPELSGRSLKSSEKSLIAEWRSYYRAVTRALYGTNPALPPAKPSGGPANKCYTEEGLIDAAIADLKRTEHLTPRQEASLRILSKKLLKDRVMSSGLVAQGWPPNKLLEWFNITRLIYRGMSGILTLSGTTIPALVVAGAVLTVLNVVLMIIGFGFALNKAMDTGYRCYACYGQAYYFVAWAYGGNVPEKSQTILDNTDHTLYGHPPKRELMDSSWRAGQVLARRGIVKAVHGIAQKSGTNYRDAERALKMIMRLESRTDLARIAMRSIAAKTKSSDPQMANAISSQAASGMLSYPH